MFCSSCGQQNQDGAAFCSKCGAALEGATSAGGGVRGAQPAKKSGGFPVWLIVLLVLMVCAVPVLGILAAIALPAYQDYTVKAKMAQAHSVGMEARMSVDKYVLERNKLPATLEEAGFSANAPLVVQSASINSEDGAISVVLGFSPHRGKTLKFVPQSEDGKTISSWKCGSDDIPPRHLPSACR
ncbi:MAG: Fimbrial protein pilin [Proteobacteria bacterium]|nr:Fimbrial protein pilin [Pseudomonadota bacterium]